MESIPIFPFCATCKIGGNFRKLSTCSGCKSVSYCSSKCQKDDFVKHKQICDPILGKMMNVVEGLMKNNVFTHKMRTILALINGKTDHVVLKCEIMDYSDKNAYKCRLSCIRSDANSTDGIMPGRYYLSFSFADNSTKGPTPFLSFDKNLCKRRKPDSCAELISEVLIGSLSSVNIIVTPVEVIQQW
jgi:MYND finger